MRIKQISVRGLFRVFDHTIPLNMEDRITIMHGPNGFGKTILLHMLDDLFNSRYSIFRRVPFTEFRVDLDNGDSLRVIKKADQHGKETVRVHSAGKEYDVTSPDRRHIPRMSMIERLVPELERVGSRQWLNTVTGHTLSLEQVLDTYGIIGDDPPEWLKQLQESFHTRFIRTERLSVHSPTPKSRYLLEHGESAVPAAVDYSQDLARTIEQSLARSVELSSSLDRSFPMRLVSPTSRELAPDLGEEELRQEKDLKSAIERLEAAKEQMQEQLQALAAVAAPVDMLKLYIETGGKVWISKRAIRGNPHRELKLQVDGYDLMYPDPMSLQDGFYRFVVMALPCEPARSEKQHGRVLFYDDYDHSIPEDDLNRQGSVIS